MRSIDADVLMELLKRKKCKTAKVRYTEGYNDALMRFRSMVHNAPTVEERKHAHWVKVGHCFGSDVLNCSNCKGSILKNYSPTFCEYCGAIMDEVSYDE